jgi:TrmH family RNA methyltransferase
MNETITSRQNSWFKRLLRAVHEHGDEIVIEGPKQVADAIASGWRPVVVVRSQVAGGSSLESDLVFSDSLFRALADTKTSQGVLALFERPRYTIDDVLARRDTIAVALDGVQDPGNVGTIVRLAAAFDASGVILLPGCADAYAPKAIRASAGAILRVPIAVATHADLTGSGRPMLYADAAGNATEPPARDAILTFGSEGAGVSPGIRGTAKPIAIAMSDRVESLNVAAAAAILLSRSFESRSRR